MKIELSEHRNTEMYFFNCKTGAVTPIDVIRESKSGDTVETPCGRRYRTDCKSHKIFSNHDAALLARRIGGFPGVSDEHYRRLLKKMNLIEVKRKL